MLGLIKRDTGVYVDYSSHNPLQKEWRLQATLFASHVSLGESSL